MRGCPFIGGWQRLPGALPRCTFGVLNGVTFLTAVAMPPLSHAGGRDQADVNAVSLSQSGVVAAAVHKGATSGCWPSLPS
jgi:hypothetical protein